MRKPLIYLISFFFILFILNCASKTYEETEKKEVAKGEVTTPAKKEATKKTAETVKEKETQIKKEETQPAVALESQLVVESASMASGVENLTPIGAGTEFTKETLKIYCFSKIIGAEDVTSVKHIWYHNDKLSAEIELPVKSKAWRTYSYKTIVPEFVGNWRVDITTIDGKVLKSLNFEIKE